LDLNGFSDAIGALTITEGDVVTGAGTLTLGGTLLSTLPAAPAPPAGRPSSIVGNLSLGNANRNVVVDDDPALPSDLIINGVLSGAAGVGFTKTRIANPTPPPALTNPGTGTLELKGTASNTYSGTTTVNVGTLLLNVSGGVAVPGNLVIGDGIGGPDADIV